MERANEAADLPGRGGAATADGQPRRMRSPTVPVPVRSAGILVLSVLAVIFTLYAGKEIILPVVLASMLALLLAPVMRFLCGHLHLPRALAAAFLVFAVFAAFVGVGFTVTRPAVTWIQKIPELLPAIKERLPILQGPLDTVQNGLKDLQGTAGDEKKLGDGGAQTSESKAQGDADVSKADGKKAEGDGARQPESNAEGDGAKADGKKVEGDNARPSKAQGDGKGGGGSELENLSGMAGKVATGTATSLSRFLTTMIVLFFLLVAGDRLLNGFIGALPEEDHRDRARIIAEKIESNITAYLLTITAMNTAVGVATGLMAWACGLGSPLLWGALAFVLNYVPVLGPLVMLVIMFAAGVLSLSWPFPALLPAAIYLVIHILEGETVTPMLLAQRFTLNPVIVIVSLFFWHGIWGVAGALLAVPLLAMFKILCDHVEALKPVGKVIGS